MKFTTALGTAALVSCLTLNAQATPMIPSRKLKKSKYWGDAEEKKNKKKTHKYGSKYGPKYGSKSGSPVFVNQAAVAQPINQSLDGTQAAVAQPINPFNRNASKYGTQGNTDKKGKKNNNSSKYGTQGNTDKKGKNNPSKYGTGKRRQRGNQISTDVPVDYNHPAPGTCSESALDNGKFCKCHAPQQVTAAVTAAVTEDDDAETGTEGTLVSVCGDATYVLPASVPVASICSGDGDAPSGNVCPSEGAETTIACRDHIMSYLAGKQQEKTGTCVAPEPATCQKLKSGAWGCVFPGNCNTRNGCLAEEACSDEYEKDEHGKCVLGANKYPVPNADYTGKVDTTVAEELPISVIQYKTAGAAAVTVSGMVLLGSMVVSMMM